MALREIIKFLIFWRRNYFDKTYQSGYLCNDNSHENIKLENFNLSQEQQLKLEEKELSQKRLIKDYVSKGILNLSKEQKGILIFVSILAGLGGMGIGTFITWGFMMI